METKETSSWWSGFFVAVLAGFAGVILGTSLGQNVGDIDAEVDKFKLGEPRWAWSSLECVDRLTEGGGRVIIRACTLDIPATFNEVPGVPPRAGRVAVFACQPRGCAWVVEP